MSYTKTEFKKTGIYHIAIGIWICISVILSNIYMNVGEEVDLFGIILGAIFIYLGIRIKKADRNFVILVICLNLLQVLNFRLNSIEYNFLFGPYLTIDVINWDFTFGITNKLEIKIGELYGEITKYFKISVINLAIVVYLLDQIRFIPVAKTKPWESEFTN